MDAARRDPVSDRRRDRHRGDVGGVRRDGATGVDRCEGPADDLRAGGRLRSHRPRLRKWRRPRHALGRRAYRGQRSARARGHRRLPDPGRHSGERRHGARGERRVHDLRHAAAGPRGGDIGRSRGRRHAGCGAHSSRARNAPSRRAHRAVQHRRGLEIRRAAVPAGAAGARSRRSAGAGARRAVSHVFLSYARRDQEFADRLVTALEGRGVNVWVDRQDIPGGAAWEAAIGEAVSVSSAVLVVLSPASVTSEYVPKELSLAEKYDRPIVPILYESWEGAADAAAVKRVEFQLAGLQYVDFAHQPFEPGLTALLRCLPATPAGVGTDRPTPAVEPRRAGRRGLLLAGAGLVALAVLAALLLSRWRGGAAPRIDGDWEAPVAYGWRSEERRVGRRGSCR